MAHRGKVFVVTKDGLRIVDSRPHERNECAAAQEEAVQRVLGHDTAYEAPDAQKVRSSVGYSRSYANNFDAAFGKN